MTSDDYGDVLDAIADSLCLNLVAARRLHAEASRNGFTTGYEIELEAVDGSRELHCVYIENEPGSGDRDGVMHLRDEATGDVMAVWLYPRDPELPTLPAAVYPAAAAVLLERLGLDATGLSLEVAAYRPGKRAVIRMDTTAGTVYLKVVKPTAVEQLRARHELWRSSSVPVPGVLAWAPDGLIALEKLSGVEAITVVPSICGSDDFVDALSALTDRIAAIESDSPARPSLASRLEWYERRLIALFPDAETGIRSTRQRIESRLRRAGPPSRLVTIHGDLHLAQLFVDPVEPHRIIGILDIDTAGIGDPADDAAALWAHLVVTAEHRAAEPELAASTQQLADRFRGRWERSADPGFADRAGPIAAAQLLGHALAGSISAPVMLALADDVLTSGGPAARARTTFENESALTTTSPVPHLPLEG